MARVRPVLVPEARGPLPPTGIDALLERATRAADAETAPPAEITPPTASVSPDPPQPSIAGAFHVQIGSYQTQSEAERRLASVREQATALLGNRAAVTAPVRQGDRTFYRARYGGFEAQSTAAGVCGELKRLKIDCLVMKAE
jgi:cell division protein FtsN